MCVAALVLISAGCDGTRDADILSVSGKMTEKSAALSDKSIHLVNPDNFNDTVAQSGLLSLYIDDTSYGVALYQRNASESAKAYVVSNDEDDDSAKYWYSLPAKANEDYDYSAASFTLDVSVGNTLYHLNSQDNAVIWGNVSCDVLGDKSTFTGYDLKYVVTVDKETAAKVDKMKIADSQLSESDFSKTDVVFLVNLKYDLLDGNFYVTSDWKNLSGNGSAVIERLGLLEFFGASDTAQDGDFMLVPDGCGAVIRTSVEDKAFKPLSFVVYGGKTDGESSFPAIFPAFGAKQGSSAYVTIVEQGDACATISADRATGKSGFNTVGVSFNLAETAESTDKGKTVRYTNKAYAVNQVKLCVRLLGGSNASYGGMAAACREQFMRNKRISTNTVKNEEYMPFNLSVIGASTGVSRLFKKIEAVNTLTTFEQAQDMLSRMKAKGINNVNVRFLGALNGGINQNKTGKLSFIRNLGGRKGFEELTEFLTVQGHSLFLDINLLSWNGERLPALKSAEDISGEKAQTVFINDMNGAIGPKTFSRHLLRLSKLEDNVINMLKDVKKISLSGFCIDDAGSLLYSDYSGDFTNRQTASSLIAANISPLSTGRLMMIDTGNFYAIKQADIIDNLPLSPAAGERKGCYDAVPFVQMIVHGTVDYSGEAVNLSDDSATAMLRCVEYGACPSYEWCYEDIESESNPFFYEDWLNGAAEFYTRANETLGDLRDTRMTDNYETEVEGIYVTEYENGAVVYVNYNDESSEFNGVTIGAKGFIKID